MSAADDDTPEAAPQPTELARLATCETTDLAVVLLPPPTRRAATTDTLGGSHDTARTARTRRARRPGRHLAHVPADLGRYAFVAELGRGGMGQVVAVHDPALKRDLAMKILGARRAGGRGSRPISGRGPAHGAAPAPRRGARARARPPRRWADLLHDADRPRANTPAPDRGVSRAGPCGSGRSPLPVDDDLQPGLRDHRLRPPPRHRAPRPQTRQRDGRRVR